MKLIEKTNQTIDSSFAERIHDLSGENVFLCYHCKKCSSGCPTREHMDSSPDEIIQYIQLGQEEKILNMNTLWTCSSCYTCSARCPVGLDVAKVINTIRIMVQQEHMKVKTCDADKINSIWMKILKYSGRMYELGLAGLLNLATGHLFKDFFLGLKMIRKRKIKLLPCITIPFTMIKIFANEKRIMKWK